MNSAFMNMYIHTCFWLFYLTVETLNHMVLLCLTFWGTWKHWVFLNIEPFCNLPAVYQDSSFSTSCYFSFFFKWLIFYEYKVVQWYFTVVLISISLVTNEYILIYLLANCISFFEKCLLSVCKAPMYLCSPFPEGASNREKLRKITNVRESEEQKKRKEKKRHVSDLLFLAFAGGWGSIVHDTINPMVFR